MFQRRLPKPAGLILLTLAALPALRADVTLHYKTEVTIDPGMPAQFADQVKKSFGAGLPKSQTQQLKDGKLYSDTGNFSSISDFNKRETTVIDNTGKRYSIIPAGEYADDLVKAMPALPADYKTVMGALKSHAESKDTGRTQTIQGIEGEERLIDITMGGPALPNMPPGPLMHMVMHVWLAKATETARVAALGELAKWDFMSTGMDPASVITKAFAQMPGLGDSIVPMMQEVRSSRRVVLRMQIEMYMPLLAMMAQMAAGGSPAGPGHGPETPAVSMNQELSEISTAPVPASAFQIPEGYQSAPATELLSDMMKRQMAASK
jgi:hypothetical protein